MPHSLAPAPDKRLVVATGNPGKLREFRRLLAPLSLRVIGQAELAITPPAETGSSFLENALIKARHAALQSGAAALADDSGLEVDALQGAPGIYSARYAGLDADDAANNRKLLAALAAVSGARRSARYRCALVFIAHPTDSAPLIAEGVWEGCILEAPRGAGGFGYDPLFWLPDRQMSAAEMDPAEKDRVSHRGMAAARLLAQVLGR
jgi:XTP/dITP diphosphohydrolase